MRNKQFDIIIIGAGSGGLSVGLFMAKAGFQVLMIARSDKDIGGECLNDGCVPSKALIHVSRIVHQAKLSTAFGMQVSGQADIEKALGYVSARQNIIRRHENAKWLKEQGVEVALGDARFEGRNEVAVNEEIFSGKKIVIATGSKPAGLNVPGVENIAYYDNENVFHIKQLPRRLLVVGAGPIGIELSQAMNRLGSAVTVVQTKDRILEHDEETLTAVLLQRLQAEGVQFYLNASIQKFSSPTEAVIIQKNGNTFIQHFDAVFAGTGRELILEPLQLHKAGIEVKDNKIVTDNRLRTTNTDVMVCGDIAGDLKFSHAAEFHGRIILNNLFSPLKKKLTNDNMSWVTFTDPELATFGLNESQIKKRNLNYIKLEKDFSEDDRAVTDDYAYSKTILYISKGNWFAKQKILGGSMIAPNAGELVQELILANAQGLHINAVFNKIYPYPVASRINQSLIVDYKSNSLTGTIKKLLRLAFNVFN